MTIVEPRVHRRTLTGVAICGSPAKQAHLTDALEDVTCPNCWAGMRKAAAA